MRERWLLSGIRPLVAALYAVAMLSLGFAHSYAGLSDTSVFEAAALQAAAFASLDGVWRPICGQSKPGVPRPDSSGFACDACQLTAAPGVIPAPPPLAHAPRVARKLPPTRTLAFGAGKAVVEPQSRGPPLNS
jgi:hypothetical protein